MLGPVAAPVIIQADLYCLKLLVDTFGKKFLNAGIFGKGDMRANVKEKSALETEGCRVTAMIGVLVVHHRGDAFGMEAMSGTEPGHSGSEDNDVGYFRVCMDEAAPNWFYVVTQDGAVIEVNTRASNPAWLKAIEGTYLKQIFDEAAKLHLAPHPFMGGGHIHIDRQSSFRSERHLLNYITRMINLPYLPLSPDLDEYDLPLPQEVIG